MLEQLALLNYKKISLPQFPIKLFECFAGIGTTRMALANLFGEKNIKSLGISEIKKSAIEAYQDIWGEDNNYGDITKIERLPDEIDILTWSFPCQDLSVAGKRAGIVKKQTRSGLGFEIPRIIANTKKKPNVLLMENVPQVEKDPQFTEIKSELSVLGYYHSPLIKLQGVDVGIPQLRKRCFMVSVLNNSDIQNLRIAKSAINTENLDFRNLCESSVEDSYYVTLHQLTTMLCSPRRSNNGRVITDGQKICPTLCEQDSHDFQKMYKDKTGRVRYLLEKEYWRLMGIDDKYFNRLKVKKGNHLYGLAGDAIIVQCLELIWKQVFK